QKVVIKLTIKREKCRCKAFQIIVSISGIESFTVKDNDQVELTGEGIDTYELIKQLREAKSVCFVELVSITLVDKPKPPEPKPKPCEPKPDCCQKKPDCQNKPTPVCLNSYPCRAHPPCYMYEVMDNCHDPPCSIL
ncbi:hypothetical protein U1Q18_000986, partial [Sarracenia purpurea var. burkii]